MNIRIDELAGYMSERHVWQLLCEISSALTKPRHGINAYNITWDEQHFSLSDEKEEGKEAYRFVAPEASNGQTCAASDIWSLGAIAFYMHMGCHVFNGRGGASQTIDSPVPFMRKEKKELSETLQRCLSFDPRKRPTAEQLCDTAKAQMKRMQSSNRPREKKIESNGHIVASSIDDFWPEEMIGK